MSGKAQKRRTKQAKPSKAQQLQSKRVARVPYIANEALTDNTDPKEPIFQANMNELPINMAPNWMKEFENPSEYNFEDTQSVFLQRNFDGILSEFLTDYNYSSLAEYHEMTRKSIKLPLKLVSQMSAEIVSDGGTLNFQSYSQLPFAIQLADILHLAVNIYQAIKKVIHSKYILYHTPFTHEYRHQM